MYSDLGLSVAQIALRLKLTSYFVRKILKKKKVRFRHQSEATRLLHMTKYRKQIFKLLGHLTLSQEKLKIAGTMIYWGEGTKGGNSVVVSNSDPDMAVIFLKFLRIICGISEDLLRAVLYYYQNQNEKDLKVFWSKKTKIPLSQFSKSFLHGGARHSYKHLSPFGTISIRYSDKKLLDTIKSWIYSYKNL